MGKAFMKTLSKVMEAEKPAVADIESAITELESELQVALADLETARERKRQESLKELMASAHYQDENDAKDRANEYAARMEILAYPRPEQLRVSQIQDAIGLLREKLETRKREDEDALNAEAWQKVRTILDRREKAVKKLIEAGQAFGKAYQDVIEIGDEAVRAAPVVLNRQRIMPFFLPQDVEFAVNKFLYGMTDGWFTSEDANSVTNPRLLIHSPPDLLDMAQRCADVIMSAVPTRDAEGRLIVNPSAKDLVLYVGLPPDVPAEDKAVAQ